MLDFDICKRCKGMCYFYCSSWHKGILFQKGFLSTRKAYESDFVLEHFPNMNWRIFKSRYEHGKINSLWNGELPYGADPLEIESFKSCPYYTEHYLSSLKGENAECLT